MHRTVTRTLRWFGLLETGRELELQWRMRRPHALPDAMIIGAMKCGTSSLHNYLTQHPGVIDPLRKEVHYFDVNYERGEAWYRAHFGRREQSGLNLDSSPYYLRHPLAAARAQALVPRARLIVLLRDPVRRSYSHYWHQVHKGREKLSFEDAIAAEPGRIDADAARLARGEIARSLAHQQFSYLARSRYAEQIEAWLECYPRDQLAVWRFEDLAADPLGTLNQVLGWLGLPAMARARLDARNTRAYPPMSSGTAARLREYFAPHNAALAALLGRDMGW
jgi:Sulfotransferase domain.